jgi:hypothetical protein
MFGFFQVAEKVGPTGFDFKLMDLTLKVKGQKVRLPVEKLCVG